MMGGLRATAIAGRGPQKGILALAARIATHVDLAAMYRTHHHHHQTT
jgi:hypothetical protein